MGRPPRCRRVAFIPEVTYFKPAGVPIRALDEVRLSVEEAESLRLKDLECLEQEDGANKMNVSRSTFQRVLGSARQKVADALLNGKAIRIEGGNFEMKSRRYRCQQGHEWDIPSEQVPQDSPVVCPRCEDTALTIAPKSRGHGWPGWRGGGR